MDSALLTVITGAGVAGVFCVLFILRIIVPGSVVDDLKAENAELKAKDAEKDAELAAQRLRADASVIAAQSVRDILAAIQFGHQLPPAPQPPPVTGGHP